jgi:hypothetical protein
MLPLVRSGNIVLGVDISNEALQVCSALSLNVMELNIKGDSIDPPESDNGVEETACTLRSIYICLSLSTVLHRTGK